jgi:hypothetical protein
MGQLLKRQSCNSFVRKQLNWMSGTSDGLRSLRNLRVVAVYDSCIVDSSHPSIILVLFLSFLPDSRVAAWCLPCSTPMRWFCSGLQRYGSRSWWRLQHWIGSGCVADDAAPAIATTSSIRGVWRGAHDESGWDSEVATSVVLPRNEAVHRRTCNTPCYGKP